MAFTGAPNAWGLLLRTIDIRPRELTCITTSGQGIIAACKDIVTIYDAITGVLQQSLSAPEIVTKIQASSDGSTLFFAHYTSATMWDFQTGGLIHTFNPGDRVNDIALSITGDHIACGLSGGSVKFWNIYTKQQGRGFWNDQPVVAIHWLSPVELVVATERSVCIHEIGSGLTSNTVTIPGHVWGLVYLSNDEFLVGTSMPYVETNYKEQCSFKVISRRRWSTLYKKQSLRRIGQLVLQKRESPMYQGQLTHSTIVGNEIACITPPSGVQSFSTESHTWTNKPPLLSAAMSVAVSLNRNLVVRTKDSIQIFSIGVLTSHEDRNDVRTSGIYLLGENHILCFQSTGHVTLLELKTMRRLSPNGDDTPLFQSAPSVASSSSDSLAYKGTLEYPKLVEAWWSGDPLNRTPDLPSIMKAWRSGNPLERIESVPGLSLIGFSPGHTMIIVIGDADMEYLWVEDVEHGTILAWIPLRYEIRMGEIHGLYFDSETRFYIQIDGPMAQRIKIPFNIIAPPSDSDPYTIIRGEPVRSAKYPERPSYTFDANFEWVLDARSRKICWISPGNLRRGSGGHFWVGRSLVMVGDDGVVRKVTFKEPDC